MGHFRKFRRRSASPRYGPPTGVGTMPGRRDADEAADELGQVLFAGTTSDMPHVEAEARVAEEGMLVLVRCTRCGGRDAYLVTDTQLADRTAASESTSGAVVSSREAARVRGARWQADHAECRTAPRAQVLPAEVAALADRRVSEVEEVLRGGGRVRPMLTLLLADGTRADFGLAHLPAGTQAGGDERSAAIARVHAEARAHVRRTAEEAVAALIVSEAWGVVVDPAHASSSSEHGVYRAPSQAPTRRDLLMVLVATPSVTFHGMAPIDRIDGGRGSGRGQVTPPTLRALTGQAPLIDGVLARII